MPDSRAKRLSYADMMKGMAVVVVVFYHLAAPGAVKTITDHLIDEMRCGVYKHTARVSRIGTAPILKNGIF